MTESGRPDKETVGMFDQLLPSIEPMLNRVGDLDTTLAIGRQVDRRVRQTIGAIVSLVADGREFDPMFDLELGLTLHGLCRLCFALGWADRGSHDLANWTVATEEPDGSEEG